MERSGILAGGNFIVDIVKMIDLWPPQESLANISHQYSSNGGGAYNLLKDLAAMQANFPLEAAGLVGNDHWGHWITDDCKASGIDTRQLQTTALADTSFTDVMTVEAGGRRTFFHYRGANALLSKAHIDLRQSRACIFHLAYMLLLDRLDTLDDHGVSEASTLLREASELGFITSADLVSVSDPAFRPVVLSSLPYTDILFLNEFEAEKLTGIQVVENGKLLPELARQACRKLMDDGVRVWVLLHFPDGAVAMGANNAWLVQGSVQVPEARIAGTVGAGDAFAAGVLMGVHNQWPMEEALKLGVCAAAACLTHATCSGGIVPVPDCKALGEQYGYRSI
jgi:sugar/nucleoside kinase (ribokinase family)